jgi:hypothetical protein
VRHEPYNIEHPDEYVDFRCLTAQKYTEIEIIADDLVQLLSQTPEAVRKAKHLQLRKAKEYQIRKEARKEVGSLTKARLQ